MGGIFGIILIGLIGGAFVGMLGLASVPGFFIIGYVVGAGVSLGLVRLLLRFNWLTPMLQCPFPYESWTRYSQEG